MKMVIMVIGGIMLAFANVGGIGYFLYLWGGTGIGVGVAAWTAFKFWVLWTIFGLTSFIVGSFLFSKHN